MPNLLILGGTTEANALAKSVADQGIPATYSYAGRVDNPRSQPVPMRVGGFGGAAGLARYIHEHGVSHVVDATHPFAAQMSRNAVDACARAATPLAALTRPAWVAQDGDNWQHVPDIEAAVEALAGPARRVFLAVGRMHLHDFAAQPQHHYLLRLVDDPDALPLPKSDVIVSRGPFSVEEDRALMERHHTQLIVSKNAGGTGARAKLDAARALGLPVLMIDRPTLPKRTELANVTQVLDWLAHT
ncbi:cobalt-precorrin-6A reductase [Ruegeria sp. SCSIO 43209]|uniref:cobalt-precorrin-6A reductase n=1 Tax=Ruegeria sp. SCSIO 43209 TaxID=2793010 RepID=UPI00147B9F38|nr:cobalt-precorrin-6A reductase [Ruegeria sp. SCSIO 43209]UAB87500.1 cobalt-precorrin-6A reductase [Ruegeria sp. SCSIO 43209]